MKRLPLLLMVLLLVAAVLPGEPVDYELAKESRMWIDGTSTVHDWTCNVGDVTGTISMDPGALTISKATVIVPSAAIDCDNGTMNKKVADALSIKKHPAVKFSLSSGKITDGGDKLNIQVVGRLDLAGQTKVVSATATATPLGNGLYKIAGKLPIAMSAFGIDPPRAMLGTLKTGNEVNVRFELTARPTSVGAPANTS